MGLDKNDHWDEQDDPRPALIYYSIRLGFQVRSTLDGLRGGSISASRYQALIEALASWQRWRRRVDEWSSNPDAIRPRYNSSASLDHLTMGLFGTTQSMLDSILRGSITSTEYKTLWDSVTWWDKGLRRFLDGAW
jgi:hypothetical protein